MGMAWPTRPEKSSNDPTYHLSYISVFRVSDPIAWSVAARRGDIRILSARRPTWSHIGTQLARSCHVPGSWSCIG